MGLLVGQGFLGAKAGFVGFVLGFLVSSGFFDAKVFFAVVREGVADKPGDILCSFFCFVPGVWGLLGSQGEPGFYFFYRDFMERQLFGENPGGFFLPFLLLPLLIFCFGIFYVPYVFFLL